MENPQLEEGYIRIANEIWKALGHYRISGEEWLVLNCILSKTYGFNKKKDKISLSQFNEYTGMKKPSIIRAIKKLISKQIVSKSANDGINIYSFNKLYSTWKSLAKVLIVSNIANDVSKSANKSLAKVLHTKDNIKTLLQKTGGILSLTKNQKEKLKQEYPNVDIDIAYKKFKLWQQSNGKTFVNTFARFKMWLMDDNYKNKPMEVIKL